MRSWEAEFNKPYNRGLLIDCEGGDTIIARTDTSAEQEEWTDALGTVTELMRHNNAGIGGEGDYQDGGGDSDDDGDDGYDLIGGRIQTTYVAQKDALLSYTEATEACTVVFQVKRACWAEKERE